MFALLRPIVLICIVLLVPIIPFVAFHEVFDGWIARWTEQSLSAETAVAIVVISLASDIFLPIPSSVVSTFAGWQLGWLAGTLASFLGMSIGAVLGFALTRRYGRPLALWLSSEKELRQMQALTARYGAAVLLLTRGVPVLSEASVLFMGMHRLAWRDFLPATLASNVGISIAYAAFGDYAQARQWLPLALGVSVALPVVLATLVKRRITDNETLS